MLFYIILTNNKIHVNIFNPKIVTNLVLNIFLGVIYSKPIKILKINKKF